MSWLTYDEINRIRDEAEAKQPEVREIIHRLRKLVEDHGEENCGYFADYVAGLVADEDKSGYQADFFPADCYEHRLLFRRTEAGKVDARLDCPDYQCKDIEANDPENWLQLFTWTGLSVDDFITVAHEYGTHRRTWTILPDCGTKETGTGPWED